MHWLRAERVEAGITQAELAKLSGIERARISEIENGKLEPKRQAVQKLQAALQQAKMPRLEDLLVEHVGTAYLTMNDDALLDLALEGREEDSLALIRAVRDEFDFISKPGPELSETDRAFLKKARRALWSTWSGVLMAGMDRGILKMDQA